MEQLIEKLEKELREAAEGKETPISFLRVVISALQWTSVGYFSALRLAGMKLGKRVGEGSEKTEISLVLEELKRIIIALKGGKVELEILPGAKGAEFKIYDSPTMAEIPNVLQNLCFFEEGFIEGYIDGVITKNGSLAIAGTSLSVSETSVEEKRCVGLGDDYCGFLIKF